MSKKEKKHATPFGQFRGGVESFLEKRKVTVAVFNKTLDNYITTQKKLGVRIPRAVRVVERKGSLIPISVVQRLFGTRNKEYMRLAEERGEHIPNLPQFNMGEWTRALSRVKGIKCRNLNIEAKEAQAKLRASSKRTRKSAKKSPAKVVAPVQAEASATVESPE